MNFESRSHDLRSMKYGNQHSIITCVWSDTTAI